jgi:tyrosinase
MSVKGLAPGISRRDFIAATGVAAVAANIPLRAQYGPPAQYVRLSLTDPGAPAMLASYQTAIEHLLQLDPNDPRNWYRNAFIHTLDCPHGNWWFLPWHRGYTGWWEQTLRAFSGNPNFAMPYWDWTEQPYVPDVFWEGVLNPSDPAFISSYDDFYAAFNGPMNAFYNSLTPAQQTELDDRGMPTAASLWAQVIANPMFFPPNEARGLTQQNPNFDQYTQQAVSLATINAALATPYFSGGGTNPPGGFGSDVAAQHSAMAAFGILEGSPHNNVHNDTGGFMRDFLSPVDPIFMAHHSNIDRLWTIWTAQQQAAGRPVVPTGDEYTPWANEPFLFYINSAGQPVTQNTAGAYADPTMFNYTYTRGSGSPPAARRAVAAAGATTTRRVTGTLRVTDLGFARAAVAHVTLPANTLTAAADAPRDLRAHITLQPPAQTSGVRYHVFVNPPENALALHASHPSYAGTFEFFGSMPHAHPVTFTVPLRETIQDLRAARTLRTDQPLQIHVVPQTRGVALRALPAAAVTKVEVTSS